MGWERIAGNWPHWKGRIRERWGRLSDDELAKVSGRREQLTNRIEKAYGLTPQEADRQLRNWERNLAVEDFADDINDDPLLDEGIVDGKANGS
jgi:uncharacterized protein YjbJ (UPF0337 family)